MIAKSKDNLKLLLILGYSPKWLSTTVAKKWIPVYGIIITGALVLAGIFQYFFQQSTMNGREELSPWLDWRIILVAVLLFCLSVIINFKLVRKQLQKL